LLFDLAGKMAYNIVRIAALEWKKPEAVAEQVRAFGKDVRILQFDLTDRGQPSILEQDMEDFGAYLAVVCNAGIATLTRFHMPGKSGMKY